MYINRAINEWKPRLSSSRDVEWCPFLRFPLLWKRREAKRETIVSSITSVSNSVRARGRWRRDVTHILGRNPPSADRWKAKQRKGGVWFSTWRMERWTKDEQVQQLFICYIYASGDSLKLLKTTGVRDFPMKIVIVASAALRCSNISVAL